MEPRLTEEEQTALALFKNPVNLIFGYAKITKSARRKSVNGHGFVSLSPLS